MTTTRPDNDRYHPLAVLAYALLTYLTVRALGGSTDDIQALTSLTALYWPLLPRP